MTDDASRAALSAQGGKGEGEMPVNTGLIILIVTNQVMLIFLISDMRNRVLNKIEKLRKVLNPEDDSE